MALWHVLKRRFLQPNHHKCRLRHITSSADSDKYTSGSIICQAYVTVVCPVALARLVFDMAGNCPAHPPLWATCPLSSSTYAVLIRCRVICAKRHRFRLRYRDGQLLCPNWDATQDRTQCSGLQGELKVAGCRTINTTPI